MMMIELSIVQRENKGDIYREKSSRERNEILSEKH